MRTACFLLVAAALVALFGFTAKTAACPMCANAVQTGESGHMKDLPRGIYVSILFMLGVPLSLVSGFGATFYVMHRRAVADRDAAALDAPPSPSGELPAINP